MKLSKEQWQAAIDAAKNWNPSLGKCINNWRIGDMLWPARAACPCDERGFNDISSRAETEVFSILQDATLRFSNEMTYPELIDEGILGFIPIWEKERDLAKE